MHVGDTNVSNFQRLYASTFSQLQRSLQQALRTASCFNKATRSMQSSHKIAVIYHGESLHAAILMAAIYIIHYLHNADINRSIYIIHYLHNCPHLFNASVSAWTWSELIWISCLLDRIQRVLPIFNSPGVFPSIQLSFSGIRILIASSRMKGLLLSSRAFLKKYAAGRWSLMDHLQEWVAVLRLSQFSNTALTIYNIYQHFTFQLRNNAYTQQIPSKYMANTQHI